MQEQFGRIVCGQFADDIERRRIDHRHVRHAQPAGIAFAGGRDHGRAPDAAPVAGASSATVTRLQSSC
ncbi:MAG: hypothetical protein MZW92_29510 [Comamonadaceae bacterium]|nr:hypothetical protein [Comamonadaceae bacterium]